MNQCDATVMSSFVPYPLSMPTSLPVTQQSSTEEFLLYNNEPSSSPQQRYTENDGSSLHNSKEEEVEVIMIDDISSNEGVMGHTVSEATALSVDESFSIDLDEQDDNSDVVLSKFVDQSSDSSSAE